MYVQAGENPEYLSTQIITYLGNKRALLDFIGTAVEQVKTELGRDRLDCGDLFSGSGIVSRCLRAHSRLLVVNDLERYCEVTNQCYLSNAAQRDMPLLLETHRRLLARLSGPLDSGFLTELYSPRDEQSIQPGERVFYTPRNARFLDTARQEIGRLPPELQSYFIAPLLSEASIKNNTSGVFKGFYKNKNGIGQYGGAGRNALSRICADITLPFPVFSNYDCQVRIYREDAYQLAQRLEPLDLIYIDPPYNQHPYGSNYFMLNLLCDYQRPEQISQVSGIPTDWNRSVFNKSRFALDALRDVCQAAPARYLLISFNSEGFVTRDQMEQMLGRLGTVSVMQTRYNAFRGSRNLRGRSLHTEEYFFLVRKR